MKKLDSQKTDEAIARAERLVYLRKNILRLTQKTLEEKYDISAKSLQNWEKCRYQGLTEEGAARLIKAFLTEGLECSRYWLLDGLGEEPYLNTKFVGRQPLSMIDPNFRKLFPHKPFKPFETEPIALENSSLLQEELALFYQGHPTAIDMVISDDGLSPLCVPNDHVAGVKLFNEDIEKAVGLACIIQMKPGQLIARQLSHGGKSGCYELRCINPETTVKQPIIENVKPLFVAPIIWIRKPDIT